MNDKEYSINFSINNFLLYQGKIFFFFTLSNSFPFTSKEPKPFQTRNLRQFLKNLHLDLNSIKQASLFWQKLHLNPTKLFANKLILHTHQTWTNVEGVLDIIFSWTWPGSNLELWYQFVVIWGLMCALYCTFYIDN